jgi:quercetin dioxygenase-like cupin family protein
LAYSDVLNSRYRPFKLPSTPMNLRLMPCLILLSATLWSAPHAVLAKEPQVAVEQLLQSTKSWDGAVYKSYPTGQPQLTVLRIKIPPHTSLHWHSHPVISVGYVVSGELTVEKRETGERITVRTGDVLPETVGTVHRGFTTDSPVELIVFYAGQDGTPITVQQD